MIKKRALFLTLIIMIIFLSIGFIGEFLTYRWAQDYQSNALNQDYIVIENTIGEIINENFNVLKGFIAYLKTNNELDQNEVQAFINELIDFDESYVNNIAILENTTIIWNFPLSDNASSIGIDLAKIPGQREFILQAMSGKIIFHGPVDLVQGGIGFIMRIPFNRNSTYFGQVSVVFNGEKFNDLFKNIEDYYDLSLAIETQYGVLYTSEFEHHKRDIEHIIDKNTLEWKIRLQPSNGWKTNPLWWTLVPFIILMLSVILGYKTYTYLISVEHHKQNANHDALTGLYNRHYLYKSADKIFNIAKINQLNVGVMVIDINNFKHINDTYGHHIGDQVLVNFAKLLTISLRPGQEVYRIGGDEYMLVFENIQDETLLQSIGERLKASVKAYQITEDYDFTISISIGNAIYPKDGLSLDDLYNKADRDMYLDKGNSNKI